MAKIFSNRNLSFYFSIFLALIVATGVIVTLWSLNRGFDLTDESWAYSLIKSGRDTVNEAWGFHWLLNPIYSLLGESVLVFRIARLFSYFMLGIFLFRALLSITYTEVTIPKRIVLFSGTQLGTFVAFSYAPPYISYNELSGWLVQLIGICLILISTAKTTLHIKWGIVGFLIGLLSVAKISSFFLVLLTVLIIMSTDKKNFFRTILYTCTGFIFSLFCLYLYGFPFNSYVNNNYNLLFDSNLQIEYAHPISDMIKKYLADVLFFVPRYPQIFLIILIVFVSLMFFGNYHKIRFNFVLTLGLFAGVVTLHDALRWNNIGVFLFFCVVLSLILEFYIYVRVKEQEPIGLFGLACRIFGTLSPLISSFGTSNPIMGQMLFASTLMLGLLVYNLVVILNEFAVFPLIVVSGWCLYILSIAVFVTPYGNQDLVLSRKQISQGDLRNIYVEPRIHNQISYLNNLGDKLEDFDFIAIDNPGALLLSNNDNFANPWINYKTWPASFSSIKYSCQEKQSKRVAVLLENGSERDLQLLFYLNKSLSYCGLKFPDDFQIVGRYSLNLPTQLWKSNSRQ